MNLFAMMETSGGAMQAERMRAEVVAANMANAETTRTAAGTPYRRQHVVFAANEDGEDFGSILGAQTLGAHSLDAHTVAIQTGSIAASSLATPGLGSVTTGSEAPGVHIAAVVEDTEAPLKRYDPGHPDAGPDGYVAYPDINPLTEMVDLMGATRAYGLNSSAVQAEKGMITSALEIAKT
jgi:flagellar basal-body rod protein FlgC